MTLLDTPTLSSSSAADRADRLTAAGSVDEPGALAGDDLAASPVEFALGALAACQVVVYRLYAQALGIQVDDVDVKAEGDLDARRLFGIDESVRAGFGAVRLEISIAGPESEERYQQLRDAVDAHCPVLDLSARALLSGNLSLPARAAAFWVQWAPRTCRFLHVWGSAVDLGYIEIPPPAIFPVVKLRPMHGSICAHR